MGQGLLDAHVIQRCAGGVRQLLVEDNFRDYYPDYQREIADYLKSLDKKKR